MNAPRDGRDDVERLDEREVFSALLEDNVEDLYENAPCGYLSTLLDGQIAKVNTTLLRWLGYERGDLVGRRHFSELLTVGGRIYHETHLAPLLSMQGEVSGIALELRTADDDRLPVLVVFLVVRIVGQHLEIIGTRVEPVAVVQSRQVNGGGREFLVVIEDAVVARERPVALRGNVPAI